MKTTRLLSIIAVLSLLSTPFILSGCFADEAVQTAQSKNSDIHNILEEISPDSIKANIIKLAGFHTRHTMSDTVSDSIGIGAARRWIYSKFKEYSQRTNGRLMVSYDRYLQEPSRRISRPTEIVNVVAVLPGTQLEAKDRMYVVSGHYDSRVSDVMNDTSFAPGANDDASGTAAVMELARVMSKYQFDATIVFMAVAGEEQGLLGATHYATQAREKNLNIEAMFTNDIIGNSRAEDGTVHDNVVRVFAEGIPPEEELSRYHRMMLVTGGENDTPARQLGRFIHDVAKEYMPDFKVNVIYRKDRYLRGGDHSAFLEQGYAAVRFSEPNEVYQQQHQDVRVEGGIQYGDLVKFVDFNYVAKVTRLNAASLATLANAPCQPQDVGVEVEKLENNTTLRWKSSSEPDLKGYEIVWRNTHQPFWEYSKFVGDTTRFTIEGVSKDNYLFGVRSVDKMGNKSPAVYPLPVWGD
jgi:hypothetical protein